MRRLIWGLAALSGCAGQESNTVLDELVGSWSCSNSSGDAESFDLERYPDQLRVEQFRQVGIDGDAELPYETDCRFAEHSTSFSLEEGDEQWPWTLRYDVDQVEIVSDPDATGPCDVFADRQNDEADKGALSYSFELREPEGDDLVTSEWSCTRG